MILNSSFIATVCTKHVVVGIMFVYNILVKELEKENASENGAGSP